MTRGLVDDVRAQPQHRAVRLHRPGVELIQAGLLLGFTFGLVMGGVVGAFDAHDWGWFTGFLVAELALALICFDVVYAWLAWLDEDAIFSGDYKSAYGSVCCEYDGKHRDHLHPGED